MGNDGNIRSLKPSFNIKMNFYGFFIVLGILVGVFVVERIKKSSLVFSRYSLPSFFDLLPWLLIPGIIEARTYHVLDYWQYYKENQIEIVKVWQGGLGIFGGLLGAVVGLWIFLRLKLPSRGWSFSERKDKKLSEIFLSYLDLGVVGLSIGQAIGRWGNYFNQELYGLPTNLTWGVYIRPENRLPGLEDFTHFHPLFLYESIGCFIIFIVLLVSWPSLLRSTDPAQRGKSPRKAGLIFFLYLFLYSFLRFWLEFLRPEGWMVRLPLSRFWHLQSARVTHIITLVLMLISALGLSQKLARMKEDAKRD